MSAAAVTICELTELHQTLRSRRAKHARLELNGCWLDLSQVSK